MKKKNRDVQKLQFHVDICVSWQTENGRLRTSDIIYVECRWRLHIAPLGIFWSWMRSAKLFEGFVIACYIILGTYILSAESGLIFKKNSTYKISMKIQIDQLNVHI